MRLQVLSDFFHRAEQEGSTEIFTNLLCSCLGLLVIAVGHGIGLALGRLGRAGVTRLDDDVDRIVEGL